MTIKIEITSDKKGEGKTTILYKIKEALKEEYEVVIKDEDKHTLLIEKY